MLTTAPQDQIAALARDLTVIDTSGPPLARWLTQRLRSCLGAEGCMVYTPSWENGHYRMGAFGLSGLEAAREPIIADEFNRVLGGSSGIWAMYDPIHVEAPQRNRVLLPGSHRAAAAGQFAAPLVRLFPRAVLEARATVLDRARRGFELWGGYGAETMRVVITDGARMLAWVSAFQHETFDKRQRRAMSVLVAPIQRRFALEERLGSAGLPGLLVPALLEEIVGAAYLLDAKHRVVAANSAARGVLAKDRGRADRLRVAASRGTGGDVTLVDLASRGVPRHSLLLERTSHAPERGLAIALSKRYGLTPREVDVLVQLGRGLTNRAIGIALGCGERTVETHVRRILEKTDRASRSELVALVWSAGARP